MDNEELPQFTTLRECEAIYAAVQSYGLTASQAEAARRWLAAAVTIARHAYWAAHPDRAQTEELTAEELAEVARTPFPVSTLTDLVARDVADRTDHPC